MADQDLIEFVRRRIDEDEALAAGVIERNNARWSCPSTGLVAVSDDEWPINTPDRDVAEHIAAHDPGRVLTECAARRYLIAEVVNVAPNPDRFVAFPDLALRLLAASWAWHEDWQPRWEVPHLDEYSGDPTPRVVPGEVVQRAKELG